MIPRSTDLSDAGPQSLSEEEFSALEEIGAKARALATKVLGAVLGRKVIVNDVRLGEMAAEDVELTFRGAYLLTEIELGSGSGGHLPILTLINRDEVSLFLGSESDDEDALEQQVSRIGDVIEVMVDSLNMTLASGKDPHQQLHFSGIRPVELDDSSEISLILPDRRLAEISYTLSDTNGAELHVGHLTNIPFLQAIAGPMIPTIREPELRLPIDDPIDFSLPDDPLPSFDMGAALNMGRRSADSGPFSNAGGPTVRPAQFVPFGSPEESQTTSNIDLLMDVTLQITVELGRAIKSIRDILDLGPGSVVELDKLAGDPVDILVNDRPIAKGEVVVIDENFGVRVTDIVSPARRMSTLR